MEDSVCAAKSSVQVLTEAARPVVPLTQRLGTAQGHLRASKRSYDAAIADAQAAIEKIEVAKICLTKATQAVCEVHAEANRVHSHAPVCRLWG